MFGWGRSKKSVLASAEKAIGDLFEPLTLLSALDRLLPLYLKETDEGRLVYPACKRGLGDTDGMCVPSGSTRGSKPAAT
ncbi:hypothetical protein ABH994_006487 [Bradyrhizobium yuanmingense]|uniref:Uncharacterized protein n=1 Tax=Bradyrhizobium yuanmingense TaxID=108015 RepID=A0ABV4GJP9_9BRAD